MKTNRHHGKVIEIYDNGAQAAVQFKSGRVECIGRHYTHSVAPYFLGMTGMVAYSRVINGYVWTFAPFKKQTGSKS